MVVATGTICVQEAMVCPMYGLMVVLAVAQNFAVIICCAMHVLRGEDCAVNIYLLSQKSRNLLRTVDLFLLFEYINPTVLFSISFSKGSSIILPDSR